VGWWSAKLVRIVGVTLVVEGDAPRGTETSAMIVSNHVSWLDVFCISAIRPTRFIAKHEVRDWPIAGWVAERAGTLFIRRARRRDTQRIAHQVHEAFAAGDVVGLFPEGTTTHGDALLRFHSSLFEPAVANSAHVHPAAIRYARPDGSLCLEAAYGDLSFMQSLAALVRQRGVVAYVAFAAALEAGGCGRRELATRAHEVVASLLGLAAGGMAPRTPADLPASPR
jgi:1-acyl-sn-glycerol-3-phosphate acyltransferase